MGMRMELMRVSLRDLALLKSGGETARRFIEANLPVIDRGPDYARRVEEMRRQMGLPAPAAPGTFDAYPFTKVFNVDKMWNGLYFLLTGSEDAGEGPATWLLHSPAVSAEIVGYTPAMEISATQTRQLSAWLDDLDRAEVLARFDGPKMRALQIYPDVWDEDPDELKDELGGAFDQLRAYCRTCADHGLGMLSYIS